MEVHRSLTTQETRAFVMHRAPYFLTEDGTLWLHEDAYNWIELDFLLAHDCDHEESLCSKCQKTWYLDHNILLVSREDPTVHTNLDAIAAQYRAEAGIPDLPLNPDPWGMRLE